MPVTYPNRTLEGIGASSGDASALLNMSGDLSSSVAANVPQPQAPQAAPQDQTAMFGQALTELLKGYQGIEKQPFAGQQYAAGQEQARRAAYTDPSLIGASPGVQAGARGAAVNAVSPTIQGAANAGQTFSSQLSTFKDSLDSYQNILQSAIQERSRQEASLNELRLAVVQAGGDPSLVDSRYSYGENITRVAPYLQKASEQKNRDTQIVNLNGEYFLVDKQTGERIADVGQAPPSSTYGFVGPGNYLDESGGYGGDGNVGGENNFIGGGNITSSARTERNNNPIAHIADGSFTSILDKAGIKWSAGSPFTGSDNQVYHTVRYNSPQEGWEGARAILSATPALENWYANHTGKSVIAQTGITNHQQFAAAPRNIQDLVIAGIRMGENGKPFDVKTAANRVTTIPTAGTQGATTIPNAPIKPSPAVTASSLDVRRTPQQQQAILSGLQEKGASPEFLQAVNSGTIPFGDADYFFTGLSDYQKKFNLAPDKFMAFQNDAIQNGTARVWGDRFNAVSNVTQDQVTKVKNGLGLSDGQVMDMIIQDPTKFTSIAGLNPDDVSLVTTLTGKPRADVYGLAVTSPDQFQLDLRNAKSLLTFTSSDSVAKYLQYVQNTPDVATRSRLLTTLLSETKGNPDQVALLQSYANAPKLTPEQDLQYRLALDGFLDSVFPQDQAVTIGISIPFLGGSRSTGVRVGGYHYFHTISEDPEALRKAGNEAALKTVLPYLGVAENTLIGGTGLGNIGGAVAGGIAGGVLGGVPGAIAGVAGGGRLGGALEDIGNVPSQAVDQYGKFFENLGAKYGAPIRSIFGK